MCENSNENNIELIEVSKNSEKIETSTVISESSSLASTSQSTLAENQTDGTSSISPTSPQPTLQPTRRRKIFYINQQQSGKFNVHLEFNDVSLVVIPKNKDPQLSLLNLLLKSAQKSNVKLSEEKKKEEITKVNGHNEDDYSKYNYIRTSTIEPSIESRAPYHVDISSTLVQQPVIEIHPKMNSNVKTSSNITRIPLLKIMKPIPIVMQSQNAIKKVSKRSIDTSFLGFNSNVLSDNNIPDESEDDRDLINTIENSNNKLNEISHDDFNEYKPEFILLGAAENCGPGRRRNSYQICVPFTD